MMDANELAALADLLDRFVRDEDFNDPNDPPTLDEVFSILDDERFWRPSIIPDEQKEVRSMRLLVNVHKDSP